jgi:hypothetical protein
MEKQIQKQTGERADLVQTLEERNIELKGGNEKMEKKNEGQEEPEGKILYSGTHDMGWVDKFLSEKEIRDSLCQAYNSFPNQRHPAWIQGIRNELPVLRYKGRHSIANGGSLSGGTDAEVFENENEKGTRYYATAGIYKADIRKSKETEELGVIFHCETEPQNVTGWFSLSDWKRILCYR